MLKPEEIARVKARGFLRNRGTDLFSGRIVAPGTVFTAAPSKPPWQKPIFQAIPPCA